MVSKIQPDAVRRNRDLEGSNTNAISTELAAWTISPVDPLRYNGLPHLLKEVPFSPQHIMLFAPYCICPVFAATNIHFWIFRHIFVFTLARVSREFTR
jgi:hypothetical protein